MTTKIRQNNYYHWLIYIKYDSFEKLYLIIWITLFRQYLHLTQIDNPILQNKNNYKYITIYIYILMNIGY